MQLTPYTFETIGNKPKNFNPLFDDFEIETDNSDLIEHYKKLLNSARNFRDKLSIKQQAFKDGINITDNGGFISEATRQCVNSRV